MDLNYLFQKSLIVYAITGTIFFLTAEVILILLYVRTKKILINLEKISSSVVDLTGEVRKKIQSIDVVSSVRDLISKYFRKE